MNTTAWPGGVECARDITTVEPDHGTIDVAVELDVVRGDVVGAAALASRWNE